MLMKSNKFTIIVAEDYYFGIPIINNLCRKYQNEIESIIFIKGFFSFKRVFYLFFMFDIFFIIKKILESKFHKKKFNGIKKKKKIKFFFTRNINSQNTLKFLKRQNSQTLIILTCPQILKKKILKVKKNNFNYHCSDLPRNRGLFPIFNTFIDYSGSKLFCSLHSLNEKIDDGKIVIQKKLEFKYLPLSEMYQRAFIEFEKVFENLINRKFNFKKNDERFKTYNSYPKFIDFINYYKIILFSKFF